MSVFIVIALALVALMIFRAVNRRSRAALAGEGDLEQEATAYARPLVYAGFAERGQIIANVCESLRGDHPGRKVDVIAERATDELLRQHATEAAEWPAETDCDRLDAAFAALEDVGIIARHDFTCCQNCGHGEIGDEIVDGDDVRGYTFYHMQDTESAVEGTGLYLAYGSFIESVPSESIAHEVVDVLRQNGFEPRWDGSVRQRIHVPFDWKRRRGNSWPRTEQNSPAPASTTT